MKNIFLFFIFLIILSSCTNRLTVNEVKIAGDGLYYYQGKPFTGQVFDLHVNGKLKFEMELKQGKKNGSIKIFNEAGELIEEENYDNGVKNGQFIKYFPDGTLEHQKIYVMNVKDGEWIINQDKFNRTIATYKMGKLDGYYKSISPYGDSEGNYQNNLKVGIWKEYDFYKRLISEKEYKKGVLDGIWKIYDPESGLVTEEGQYKKGGFVNMGREGYESVKIGNQIWMAENLNSVSFQNGEMISKEDYRYHRNDPESYAKKYGILYNWKVVNDKRNICPTGWRIPTKTDWEILLNFLGDDSFKKLKSSSEWEKFYGTSGSNETGMNVLPLEDNSAFFWSSTESEETYSWGKPYAWVISFGRSEYIVTRSKKYFEPCRCIKN